MKRRIFAILSAISLVLWAGLIAFWARSYWVEDALQFSRQAGQSYVVFSSDGVLSVCGFNAPWFPAETNIVLRHQRRSPGLFDRIVVGSAADIGESPGWRFHSFEVTRSPLCLVLAAPYWAVVLPLSVLPCWSLHRRWKRRQLRRVGLCPACGYDLTGNVSGICPECGTPVAKERAT